MDTDHSSNFPPPQALLASVNRIATAMHSASVTFHFDDIIQKPIVNGRRCETTVKSRDNQRWEMMIKFSEDHLKYSYVLRFSVYYSEYQMQECEALIEKVAQYLQRWPFPLANNDFLLKKDILVMVSYNLFPHRGFSFGKIKQKHNEYVFTVNLIDPIRGKQFEAEISLKWDAFETLIRPIQPSAQHVTLVFDANMTSPPTPAQKNAISFIKFIVWRFYDRHISLDTFQQTIRGLQCEYTGADENEIAGESTTRQLPFPKHFSVAITPPGASIRPTEQLQRTTNELPDGLSILVANQGHTAFVLDRMDEARDKNPADLFDMWQIGCTTADRLNQADQTPSRQCSCRQTDEEKVTPHRCNKCFERAFCSTMSLDAVGRSLCGDCA